MPDCEYCEQSFPDEGSLLEHMGEAHEGELGRIDQRRVEDHYGGDDTELSTTIGYAIVGIVFVAVIGGAVYAAVGAFSEPPAEQIHEHGSIEMTIGNESVNFDQSEYYTPQEDKQVQDFHFHSTGLPDTWHMHPSDNERLTLAEAMEIADIGVTSDSVTYEGETYSAADPNTTISVLVDGEPVDPESYELQGAGNPDNGDQVEIVVETGN
ncbi:hypothetical protein [Salinarchaeum laminariae]|uniref:hypothetical protein n=1 Tax=Salinarchaeum laminariae TaxID=869888 RepID=UPI0020C14EDF|nr:hypothetical protein [Salinarchaeum laminariae]